MADLLEEQAKVAHVLETHFLFANSAARGIDDLKSESISKGVAYDDRNLHSHLRVPHLREVDFQSLKKKCLQHLCSLLQDFLKSTACQLLLRALSGLTVMVACGEATVSSLVSILGDGPIGAAIFSAVGVMCDAALSLYGAYQVTTVVMVASLLQTAVMQVFNELSSGTSVPCTFGVPVVQS